MKTKLILSKIFSLFTSFLTSRLTLLHYYNILLTAILFNLYIINTDNVMDNKTTSGGFAF